ncbi:5643_t:CDS:2, partial [Cetraspora pellucida]
RFFRASKFVTKSVSLGKIITSIVLGISDWPARSEGYDRTDTGLTKSCSITKATGTDIFSVGSQTMFWKAMLSWPARIKHNRLYRQEQENVRWMIIPQTLRIWRFLELPILQLEIWYKECKFGKKLLPQLLLVIPSRTEECPSNDKFLKPYASGGLELPILQSEIRYKELLVGRPRSEAQIYQRGDNCFDISCTNEG